MSNAIQAVKPKSPVLIKQLDDETLLKELRACWHVSTQLLDYMATLYREAASRASINLSEFRGGLWESVKLVARGVVDNELAVKLHTAPQKLAILADLPKDVQRDVASGAKFKVVELDASGRDGVMTTDKSIHEMTTNEVRLVMGGGGLRTVAEQRRQLASQAARAPKRNRSPTKTTGNVRVDADTVRGVVIVGAYTLKPYELAAALDTLGFKLTRKAAK